jgi:Niemann-Pick C2 protein
METLCGILVLSFLAAAAATTYRDCGSRESVVQALQVSNCPDGQPLCTFTRGTNASIKLDFTPQVNINQLNVRVYGIIGGIPVEFTMPQPNACIASGLKCPLSDGTAVEYLTYVPVLPVYPNIKAVVKFELVDAASGLDAACAMFPVQIVGGDGKKAQQKDAREGLEKLALMKPEEKKRTEKIDRLTQRLSSQLKKSPSRSHSEVDTGRLDVGSSLARSLKKLLEDPKIRERLSGSAFWDTLASVALRRAKENPKNQMLASLLDALRANQNQHL